MRQTAGVCVNVKGPGLCCRNVGSPRLTTFGTRQLPALSSQEESLDSGDHRAPALSQVHVHGVHAGVSAEMPSQATVGSMAEPIASVVPRPAEHRESEALEFPGCRPVRIPRAEIADYDGRFEYWDRDTEVAMVCEPVSYYHERPGQRLARLVQTIAHVRGAPIEAVGATDLLVRNARGERQRIMQADQILFLRPVETVPRGHAIEVGVDALPDVVLEVDSKTFTSHWIPPCFNK